MFEKKSTENGISSFQALIIAIVLLSRIAFDTLKDYEKQKAQGIDPVFHERNIGIDNTDVWK